MEEIITNFVKIYIFVLAWFCNNLLIQYLIGVKRRKQ